VLLGDGGGRLAFAVVAVAEVDGPPLVDHDDGGEVDRDGVVVDRLGSQGVEVGAELEQPALDAQGAEGDRVPLGV
jgi:hypothetical protein